LATGQPNQFKRMHQDAKIKAETEKQEICALHASKICPEYFEEYPK